MTIRTKRVTGRRQLRFTTLDEALCDAEHLAAGPHRCLGNYTLGEIAAHLAQTIGYSLDGFPPAHVPWFFRTLGPLIRGRLLRNGFSAGIQPRGDMKVIFTPPKVDLDEGMRQLRELTARASAEPHRQPSPMFGLMSREEWDQFHCRHAELHLGFVVRG